MTRARSRAGSRSPSASASRFACTLVSGVRSSCEASEIELALGQPRALERGQHRVEARRQPPELVLLAGVDAVAEVLRARDAFGGTRQPPHGHQRRARDEQPERGRQRDPAEAHEREHQPQVRERAVDVGQAAGRPATPRPRGARSVSTRTRVPATSRR